MSLRNRAASLVRGFSRLPGIKLVLWNPAVRGTIQTWPIFGKLYGTGWELLHPFDRSLGSDTSGFVGPSELPSSPFDSQKKHGYAGSQPSIIRTALSALPSPDSYSFIDLGCGKGRPLLVASEFSFRALIGVELSPALVEAARANAAILRQKFPKRGPIRIDAGDASVYPFPAGDFVVFLYNPFGEEVVAKVAVAIESALAAERRSIFVVYYNPVFGAVFDASRSLTRYFAGRLPFAQEECGYTPDADDSVVIWQGGGAAPAHAGADARIQIVTLGMRAEVDDGVDVRAT